MADVVDGTASGTPLLEKGGDVGFCFRVVSLPPVGMIDRILKINDEEGSVVRERSGQARVHGVYSAAVRTRPCRDEVRASARNPSLNPGSGDLAVSCRSPSEFSGRF